LDEAKEIASKMTGIPTDKMLISSTHSHSAAPLSAKGAEPVIVYRKLFVEGVAESIVKSACGVASRAFGAAVHPLPEEVFKSPLVSQAGKNAG